MNFKAFENCLYKDEFISLFNTYLDQGIFDEEKVIKLGYEMFSNFHITHILYRLENIKTSFVKDIFKNKTFDENLYDKIMLFFKKLQDTIIIGYSKHCIESSDYLEDEIYKKDVLKTLLESSSDFKNSITKDFINLSSIPSITLDPKTCEVYEIIQSTKISESLKQDLSIAHDRLHEIAKYFYELLKEKDVKNAYIAYWRMRYLNILIITVLSIYALEEEEEFYKTFFEEHSVPMLVVDKNSSIVKANKSALNFYGYTQEEITSLHNWDINVLPKDTMDKLVKKAIQRKENFFRFQHKLKSGEIRDVDVYSSPVNIKGETYLLSIIHDVTKERKYQRLFNIIRKIQEVSLGAISKLEFLEKLSNIIKTDNNIQSVCMVFKDNNMLKPILKDKEWCFLENEIIDLSKSDYKSLPLVKSVLEDKIVLNKNTEENINLGPIKNNMLLQNKNSSVAIPILEGENAIGSICMCSKQKDYFEYSEDFTEEIKTVIKQTLDRFSLQEKLKTSKEFFEAISENTLVGIIVYDMDKIHYINKTALNILGYYDVADASFLTIFDILSPRHTEEIINSFLNLENINKQFLAITKDYKIIDIQFTSSVIKNKEGSIAIATLIDISQEIENRKIIESQRKLLQTIIDDIDSGIIVFKLSNYKFIEIMYTNKYFKLIMENKEIKNLSDLFMNTQDIMHLQTMKELIIKNIRIGNYVTKALFRLLSIDDKEGGHSIILGVFYDISEEYTSIQKYKLLSETDALTNICNRGCYEKMLERYIGISKRYQRPLSLIMFDIDHFKNINDTFGHDVGDIVLQTLAKIVSNNIRNTDIFARYGGEEFMIIALETSLNDAINMAEKIKNAIELSIIKAEDYELNITCSFGVATFHPDDTKESLEKRVDMLLYLSKSTGRNKVSYEDLSTPPHLILNFRNKH